jgi:hypothetical protein
MADKPTIEQWLQRKACSYREDAAKYKGDHEIAEYELAASMADVIEDLLRDLRNAEVTR